VINTLIYQVVQFKVLFHFITWKRIATFEQTTTWLSELVVFNVHSDNQKVLIHRALYNFEYSNKAVITIVQITKGLNSWITYGKKKYSANSNKCCPLFFHSIWYLRHQYMCGNHFAVTVATSATMLHYCCYCMLGFDYSMNWEWLRSQSDCQLF